MKHRRVAEDAGRGWRRVVASPVPKEIVELDSIRVLLDSGRPTQRFVDRMDLAEAHRCLAEGTHFAKGSMAPKIRAVVECLEAGRGRAVITDPVSMGRALRGEADTVFLP